MYCGLAVQLLPEIQKSRKEKKQEGLSKFKLYRSEKHCTAFRLREAMNYIP